MSIQKTSQPYEHIDETHHVSSEVLQKSIKKSQDFLLARFARVVFQYLVNDPTEILITQHSLRICLGPRFLSECWEFFTQKQQKFSARSLRSLAALLLVCTLGTPAKRSFYLPRIHSGVVKISKRKTT